MGIQAEGAANFSKSTVAATFAAVQNKVSRVHRMFVSPVTVSFNLVIRQFADPYIRSIQN
jgi:hypothetical protein